MRFDPHPPKWYELLFYSKAREEAIRLTEETSIPHQVDHIVPRHSPIVHGFDVEWNLQACHGFLNAKKGNRWWPTMTAAEVREAIAFYKARGDI